MSRPARVLLACVLTLIAAAWPSAAADDLVDISRATVVVRGGPRPAAERAAADVLVEEVERRLGTRMPVATAWPSSAPVVIVVTSAGRVGSSSPAQSEGGAGSSSPAQSEGRAGSPSPARVPPVEASPWPGAPALPSASTPEPGPEGYRLRVTSDAGRTVVWVLGADGRGALFGVGHLLRELRWTPGGASALPRGVPATLDVTSTPAYSIRGHQLGYRHHSNTYDAWDEARYDRYVRELALLGVNSIENIPFQDTRVSPHFPLPRDEMNVAISRVCARYDLDYWIWAPADFDLNDAALRAKTLDALEALFVKLPRIDHVFVPGGDPGHNRAELVLPWLKDLGERLRRHHPRSQVWLSLQWFDAPQIAWIYEQINEASLPWLGGLVAGPSSPPLAETRARLHPRYRLRDYPDVTHVVRAQYVVPDWDPAYNFTLGREPINPRPVFYASLHDRIASHTDGFISYSDGVNDDVNKAVWSRKAWAPSSTPREILIEYARLFFGESVAERAADGLLALEKNWEGPLATNGAVDGTLAAWQRLEAEMPALEGNWRWQQALFRAYYDAYTRHRLLRETAIEQRANAALLALVEPRPGSESRPYPPRGAESSSRPPTDAAAAVARAKAILAEADTPGPHDAWRARIVDLGAALFRSIGMQMDTPTYKASGTERGAVLDFLHYPLNNRWWLEDEFTKALALPGAPDRRARLQMIARWEDPGPGGFYDDLGHIGRSPHVQKAKVSGANPPELEDGPTPHFTWEQEGRSRKRLAWQVSLRWPIALVYEQIDPSARYVLRLNGNGDVRLRINGVPVQPAVRSTTLGEPKVFDVPLDAIKSRRIVVTFDDIDESDRNWRQHSRVHEAWLLEVPPARVQ